MAGTVSLATRKGPRAAMCSAVPPEYGKGLCRTSTYTTTEPRHYGGHAKDTMASLAALLERLYETEVIDTADVARVSGRDARSVSRWHAGQADTPRESEERWLELKAVVAPLRGVMKDAAARLWLRS